MEQEQYTQENSMDFDYGFDNGSDYEFENETERLEVRAEPAEDQEAMDFEDNNEQLEVLDEYVPGKEETQSCFKCLSQFRCKTLIQSLYPVKPVYHDIYRQGYFLFGDETVAF
ncbi:hypothetical protein [Absidia glauca]|uniref:Uncharacterized protein n=1 Tax=Absidia glauca TaxID=4829 RepID=A0A168S2J4_ABSGL|nr:hypothetical protein [Absidia glauca]SAM07715.1 hypothetical protein [Absidia glauca]